MNARQLRDVVIVPSLVALGLYNQSATNLLLGTCAQESNMGHYIIQQKIGFKGGIGLFQMEKVTFDDIWSRKVNGNISMKAKLRLLLGYEGNPPAERMATDLALAVVMARLFYADVPEKLPDADDIAGMAAYWKKYFNTKLGAGTTEEFISNYKRYVGEI